MGFTATPLFRNSCFAITSNGSNIPLIVLIFNDLNKDDARATCVERPLFCAVLLFAVLFQTPMAVSFAETRLIASDCWLLSLISFKISEAIVSCLSDSFASKL